MSIAKKKLAVKLEVKIIKLKPQTLSGCFTNKPPVEPVPTKCALNLAGKETSVTWHGWHMTPF